MTALNRKGLARVELLVVVGSLILVVCIASLMIAQPDRAASSPLHSKSVTDAAQIRSIHQSWLTFAKEFNGLYPRPGLINRLPDPALGQIPGRGPEDVEANTTANLFSAMVMQNFISPEGLISPVERNPKVRAPDNEYNYEKYDPSPNIDIYWDSNFKADLKTGSNVSYAHMPMCGERAVKYWRESMSSRFPLLGNRGPKDGKLNPDSFTCGPHGNWAGNIGFSHDDVKFLTNTQPENLTYAADGAEKPDNLFAIETGHEGADAIIAFTRTMSKEGKPELQFD